VSKDWIIGRLVGYTCRQAQITFKSSISYPLALWAVKNPLKSLAMTL